MTICHRPSFLKQWHQGLSDSTIMNSFSSSKYSLELRLSLNLTIGVMRKIRDTTQYFSISLLVYPVHLMYLLFAMDKESKRKKKLISVIFYFLFNSFFRGCYDTKDERLHFCLLLSNLLDKIWLSWLLLM